LIWGRKGGGNAALSFLPFEFCFAGMSNPPYGGVELPFLKGDLEGFLYEVKNVVAQFIGQLCLMNQAATKSGGEGLAMTIW
jgi:hypothetical protein